MKISRAQGLVFLPYTGKDNAHGLSWRDFFFFLHLCRLFPNHFSGMLQNILWAPPGHCLWLLSRTYAQGCKWQLPCDFYCLPLGAFPSLQGWCVALSEASNTPNVPVLSSWQPLSPSYFLLSISPLTPISLICGVAPVIRHNYWWHPQRLKRSWCGICSESWDKEDSELWSVHEPDSEASGW